MPHEKYLKGHMLVILLKIIYPKSIYRGAFLAAFGYRYKVFFWGDKNVSELNSIDGYAFLWNTY